MMTSNGRKGTQAKVLIVEDERPTIRMYEDFLGDKYNVVIATNGKVAIEELDSSFDILLLDWKLPRMTGAEFLSKIPDKDTLGLRIAMVTSKEPDIDIINLNIDEYKTKPIFKEELQDLVKYLTLKNDFFNLCEPICALKAKHKALSNTENKNTEEFSQLESEIERTEIELNTVAEELGRKIDVPFLN